MGCHALQVVTFFFEIVDLLTIWFCTLPPLAPLKRWIYGVPFTFFALMAMVSYVRATSTDAGQPPPGYVPSGEVALGLLKRNGQPRWCRKCKQFKPARAHHCQVCGRCSLELDHHCPWVNRCVGLKNRKFFFLFLVYTLLASIYTIGLCGYGTVHRIIISMPPPIGRSLPGAVRPPAPPYGGTVNPIQASLAMQHAAARAGVPVTMALVFGVAYGFMFAIASGSMVIATWELVFSNITTVESFHASRYAIEEEGPKGVKCTRHVYDMGWKRNAEAFFASPAHTWWLWLMPIPGKLRGSAATDPPAKDKGTETDKKTDSAPAGVGEGVPASEGRGIATATAAKGGSVHTGGPEWAPGVLDENAKENEADGLSSEVVRRMLQLGSVEAGMGLPPR